MACTPPRRCGLLMSEALAPVGAGGGLGVPESRVGRKKSAGGPLVSMVLTSTRHRRRTLRRNLRIPTILGEVLDGGLVDVSAVDTGPSAGSTPPGPGRWGRALSPHGLEPPLLEPRAFPCLAASGACAGPGGCGSMSAPAHSPHQWLGMSGMPRTQAPRLGTSCACGDISVRPGASCALGDGIAVPDGVECPRPEGHAPGRAECPRRWWGARQ